MTFHLRIALFSIALGMAGVAACAGQPAVNCASTGPEESLAIARLGDDQFRFVHLPPTDLEAEREIELVRHRPANGCQPERIDLYPEEGGAPRLEAAFVHKVHGEPNLFAIVSWPRWHVGIGMRGTYYAVHAYRREGDAFVPNAAVVEHGVLYGGFVGIVEGQESTFEGTTPDGVIAMLRRFDLE